MINGIKKYFCIRLIILLLSWGVCHAEAETHSTTIPIRLSSPLSQTLQRLTGITWLASKVGSCLGKKEIQKQLLSGQNHLTLKIKAYSASDLKRGNIKGIQLSGKNLAFKQAPPLSTLSVASDPATPIYLSDTRHPVLLRPVQFKLQASLSENTLNAFFKSPAADPLLKNVKVDLPPFSAQYVDILSPIVNLSPQRLNAQASVVLHEASPETALPVQISGVLTPKRNRLQLSDINLAIDGLEPAEAEALAGFIERYFGEILNLDHLKLKNHKIATRIDRCDSTETDLTLEATLTLKATDKALARLKR